MGVSINWGSYVGSLHEGSFDLGYQYHSPMFFNIAIVSYASTVLPKDVGDCLGMYWLQSRP